MRIYPETIDHGWPPCVPPLTLHIPPLTPGGPPGEAVCGAGGAELLRQLPHGRFERFERAGRAARRGLRQECVGGACA